MALHITLLLTAAFFSKGTEQASFTILVYFELVFILIFSVFISTFVIVLVILLRLLTFLFSMAYYKRTIILYYIILYYIILYYIIL